MINYEDYKIEDFTPIDYKTLSELKCGKAVIEAAVNRWTDELYDIGEYKEAISVAYDNLINAILKENETYNNVYDYISDNIEGIAFNESLMAIIRIVIENINNPYSFNIEEFFEAIEASKEESIDELAEILENEECTSETLMSAKWTFIMARIITNYFNENED